MYGPAPLVNRDSKKIIKNLLNMTHNSTMMSEFVSNNAENSGQALKKFTNSFYRRKALDQTQYQRLGYQKNHDIEEVPICRI
jgi:hypothetical protein